MTHTELEELGFVTIATDNNSFVSKIVDEYVWLEVFYCKETGFLQIMRCIKGNNGETLKSTLCESKNGKIDILKMFLK
jgi:hypothetical protein